MKKEKKKWGWHFLFSVLLHILIIAGLAVLAVRFYQERTDKSSAAGGGSSAKPEVKPQDIKQAVETEDARIKEMSTDEKMTELRKKSAELEDINPAVVDAVAGAVETVKGADTERAYEPAKNVPGKFDPNTATIYDIVREERKDQPVYIYTLVDAKGHSMTVERKMEEMSADDMRAYQIFAMSRNNKNMGRLLKTAIKIGQTQADESENKSTPTSTPAK